MVTESATAPMVLTDRDRGVLRITLNRPAKRNAFHPDLIRDLSGVLAAADNDSSVNVLVITGAGTTFCSGLDLVQLSSLATDERVQYMGTFLSLLRQVYRLRQPVIAAGVEQ